MLINILKSEKTIGGFGNLYVNNKKENRGRIRIDCLHLVSRHF